MIRDLCINKYIKTSQHYSAYNLGLMSLHEASYDNVIKHNGKICCNTRNIIYYILHANILMFNT